MKRRWLRYRIASCLLGALAAVACGRSGGPGPYASAPVILISIDTLRADHLPPWGYRSVDTPAIAQLAQDGIVFENAYSHYPLTFPSHTSMLSGLLPPEHGVRDNIGYSFDAKLHPDLATLLAGAGYATGGFVSAFVLRRETGLAAGFSTYDSDIEIEPGAALDSGQRPGAETTERAIAWLRQHASGPVFLFLHLYEPHTPFTPPEPFKSRYASSPYDGEIATADASVGRLLAELRALALYDRAIVLLVGDHGEGLGDHGEIHHGVFLYRSTLHVPMIVKLPGRERAGTRVAAPVGLADLAPTVVGLTGLHPETRFDGRSLFAPADPQRGIYSETYYPRLHFGWSDLKAYNEARWSLVSGPDPELYDLAADPDQASNVLEANRREFARLRDLAAAIDKPLAEPEAVDAETSAKLAALGYLSGAPVRSSGPLPDPKSQRHLLEPIERGTVAFNAGKYDEAAGFFRTALSANPSMYDIWLFLARSLSKAGRDAEAERAWEKTLDLSGGSTDIAVLVASTKFRLRKFVEARALAEAARPTRPREADDLLAQIDLAEGHTAAAMSRMEIAAREGHVTEGIGYHLAMTRLGNGEPQQAIDLLAPFAAKGGVATLTVYASALSQVGRNDEALAVLERASAIDDRQAKLHETRGIVLLRLGRVPEARAALERALAIDSKLPDSWNTLGVALFQLAGPRPAMDAWRRALTLDSTQYEALLNLGLVAMQTGDRAEARRTLERFVAIAPPQRFADDLVKARQLLRQLGG
jgi:arylsulfatase A-like enzyme/Tfp pilus assembly protein PilF